MGAREAQRRGGCFLCFEGVEGAGKTTQARLLADALRRAGREVVLAREPGSTPLGERVRETVLLDGTIAVPARAELFLMLAARAAFVEQVVLPTLQRGGCVIADRFELSTLAYQSAGRGLPLEDVLYCNRVATGGASPDLTVLLDLHPNAGRERQRAEGKHADRMEREGAGFHERVAAGYRALTERVPGLISLDAAGAPAEVHARVLDAVRGHLPDLLGSTNPTRPLGSRAAEAGA